MEKINKHIEEYLDYYCKIKNPEYAILLKGPWGSGKTWFIEKYLKKIEKREQKKIYISLYGINSISEIEEMFFQQLHPLLASKGMAIAGKVLRGLLKTTVKIDLDGNSGSSNIGVSSQIPEIDVPEYLKNTQNAILIFDDLERCALDIETILGYINYFVEHQGLRVVIIAHEDDILKREAEKKQEVYKKIKEKLVGKTFKIDSNLDIVLNDFIKEISILEVRNFLKKNVSIIKEIFNLTQYENLRHLKQSIRDFERFFNLIPKNTRKHNLLLTHLLKFFMIFSFEIRHGGILPSDLFKMKDEYINKFVDNKKERTILGRVIEKYGNIDFFDILLTEKCWVDFFDKGTSDVDIIKESLKNSSYYQDKNTPEWIKLWHYRDLEDDRFILILNNVVKNYKEKRYKKLGIVEHVFGLLLYFSKVGLYQGDRKLIVSEFREYVEYLKNENLLLKEKPAQSSFNNDSYAGLQIYEMDTPDFKKAILYVDKKINESNIENMPNAGNNLLKVMVENVDRFYQMICLCDSDNQLYYKIPIFKYIKPHEFINKFLSINPANQRHVIAALSERYRFDDINNELLKELDWLKAVLKGIDEEARSRNGRLSGFLLKSIAKNYLKKMINKLEDVKKKNSSNKKSVNN